MKAVSNRHAREILDALDRSHAIVEFDVSGVILRANENFLRTFGYALSEIKGCHHRMLVTPADRDSSGYHQFWVDLAAGQFKQAEFKRLAKGGREVWIQASYNPILGRNGVPTRILKVATDITIEMLRSIDCAGQISALHRSQAVIELGLDGTIITANEKFLKTFGYELGEIVGRPHRMFVDEAMRTSEEYRRFWDGLSRGEFQSGEFRRMARDGRAVFIQASYNPVYDRDGRPLKIVKFATDVTLQVEDRLRRAHVQTTVQRDLTDIASATNHVAQQAVAAASNAKSVLSDVNAMISEADHLFSSVDALGDRVAEADTVGERVVCQIRDSAATMSNVSAHASCIQDVVALIQRVATQINLLALNATIEAARAGEAGRGFTVVAQEVKALADQTNSSAKQIQDQVVAMRTATDQAASTFEAVRQTVQLLNGVEHAIRDTIVTQSVRRQSMASGMKTVSESAQAITGSMDVIAKATASVDISTQKLRIASQAIV